MSSVIRVSSGDTIQVRTGVLQGIGPVGPTGPTGPQGLTGPQGIQGEKGPQGATSEGFTSFTNSGTQGLPTAVWTAVTYDTLINDDYSANRSTSTFQPGVGTWYVSAYFSIGKQAGNAVGSRGIRIVTTAPAATTISGITVAAAPGNPTDLTLSTGFRITDPLTYIAVHAYQAEGVTVNISAARFWLSKLGSGPQGAQGIQGVQGPIGPQGGPGPAGPAGAGANATTTFTQIEAG